MTELEYVYWSEAVVSSVAEHIYVSAELVIHMQSVFYDMRRQQFVCIDTNPCRVCLQNCSDTQASICCDGCQTFALEYNINMFSFPCFILYIFERYLFVNYCYYLSICLLLLLKITVSSMKTKRHKISVKN